MLSYSSIDENAEIVYQTFAVEEVVGSDKKVPGERTEPRQTVDSVHCVADIDYFCKAFHLNDQCLKKLEHTSKL